MKTILLASLFMLSGCEALSQPPSNPYDRAYIEAAARSIGQQESLDAIHDEDQRKRRDQNEKDERGARNYRSLRALLKRLQNHSI